MFSYLYRKIKVILLLFALLVYTNASAADPASASIFNNSLAVILLILMAILVIIIGILGSLLIGVADVKKKKQKTEDPTHKPGSAIFTLLLLLCSFVVTAQDQTAGAEKTVTLIGGLAPAVFYLMIAIIFLELLVVIVLLINVRMLMKKEKLQVAAVTVTEAAEIRKNRLSWWDRFNKLKPVSEEAELDLGHEYDGIRELNNRLPPWWLYGFYATIVFAGIYLWRFHVSHTGPTSKQEYELSMAKADKKIKEYLKSKGDAVDENSVTLLKSTEDLESGRLIFIKSCAACHQENGAGNVGPNLTDNYWLHGNDVKSIFKIVRYGINAMPQWQNSYSNKEIAQVTSYIKSLIGSNPPNAKEPQGVEIKEEVPKPNPTDTTQIKIVSGTN